MRGICKCSDVTGWRVCKKTNGLNKKKGSQGKWHTLKNQESVRSTVEFVSSDCSSHGRGKAISEEKAKASESSKRLGTIRQ